MVYVPMGSVEPAKNRNVFLCVSRGKIQKDMSIKILNLYKKAKITEFSLHLHPEHVA